MKDDKENMFKLTYRVQLYFQCNHLFICKR